MPDGTPGNGANPPFGNGNGATQKSGASSGAHNFITDPKSNSPATGGRDFSKESRPQQMRKPSPGYPNTQEIPTGGTMPLADPGPVSKSVSGNAGGVQGVSQKPFRVKGG